MKSISPSFLPPSASPTYLPSPLFPCIPIQLLLLPYQVPETEKGAREVVRTQIEGEQHLFIEAFSDPNCVESSAYGFMSFKLNTCTPAWMFSYETQQVYLKNTAYQKVGMSSFFSMFLRQ